MQIKYNLLVVFLFLSISSFAQEDITILRINGEKISKEEFIRNANKRNAAGWNSIKDSVIKYLNEFIEFKLSVAEAKSIGLDKTQEFIAEINAFRKELIKPYLADQETIDYFAKQSYERAKTEIRIRQILIRIDINASAQDSILAYQKALNIRKKLESGEDFAKLASQFSDDPMAQLNGGDLWYIRPFKIPYVIENYIYSNTQQMKYSSPIRSSLGYHIVEIIDKRPSQGKCKVSHILLSFPLGMDENTELKIKQKADSIYQLSISGTDFAQLALKYSNDKGTSTIGGELPWFETGDMPHEFESASFMLNRDGLISKPIKTKYGWHIIKRISHQDMPAFEQIGDQIINLVLNSEKGRIAVEKNIEKLKRTYHFKEYNVTGALSEIIDSTIFSCKWQIPENAYLPDLMFSFDNQNYNQIDFAKFLQSNQKNMMPIPIENYILAKYKDFVNQSIIDYESKRIESIVENSFLIKDFSEERLSIAIMEKAIWNKTLNDETDLLNFYKKNKENYNKLLMADVCIYSYGASNVNKLKKQFKKLKNEGLSDSIIEQYLQSNLDDKFKLNACYQKEEGQDALIDLCINQFKKGELTDERLIDVSDKKIFIWLNKEITKTNKPLDSLRDQVLADYQNYAENIWMKDLKKKYLINIDNNVVESLYIK